MLQAVTILVTFVLIGYAVGKMGAVHYGGWTSIVSIISYLMMLDGGMSVAIQHYVARLSARGEKQAMVGVYNSALIVYVMSGLLAAGLCLVMAAFYPAIFRKIPVEAAHECSRALWWVAGALFLYMLNMPTQGALIGLQRYDWGNAAEAVSQVVRLVTVIALFVLLGPSLVYLGTGIFAQATVRCILNRIALRRLEPSLRLRLSSVSRQSFKDIFSFGGHSVFWTIVTCIVRESGPILAALLLGAAQATYLYIGIRLVRVAGSFVTSAGQVFLPMASALHGAEDQARLRSVVMRSTRLCALLGFAGGGMLLTFGRPVLDLWVGSSASQAYGVLVVTTLGMLGTWAFYAAEATLIGSRVLWPLTFLQLFRMVAGLGLSVLFALRWGVTGLAAGYVVPVAISYIAVVPFWTSRLTGLRLARLLTEPLAAPLFVAAVIGALGWLLCRIWPATTWPCLIGEVALCGLVFAVLSLGVGLDSTTRKTVTGALRRSPSRVLERV